MENKDCFAYNERANKCNALACNTCKGCKFYATLNERNEKFRKANKRLEQIGYIKKDGYMNF